MISALDRLADLGSERVRPLRRVEYALAISCLEGAKIEISDFLR